MGSYDARDPEPAHRTLDMRKHTSGAYVFEIDMDVWVYSGLRNEKVYSRAVTFIVRASRAEEAMGLAEMLSATIKAAHDVYQTRITRVQLCDGRA